MPKVLCTLPNASEEISGVKFVSHAKGMLSEEIDDEAAAVFASIPGYEIVGEVKKPAATTPEDEAKAAERAALVDKAEALGLKVKSNWSLERLSSEIQAAEAAAAKSGAKAADTPAAE